MQNKLQNIKDFKSEVTPFHEMPGSTRHLDSAAYLM